MVRKYASALAVFVVSLMVLPLAAQAPGQSELSAIHQIKDEGFNDSKVMEIMSYLTDVYGPRLTNSPDIKEAANWTTGKMKEWQLANVHLEPWGPFGRGWSNERFSAQVISPRPFPLIAYPKAWTPGTNGPVTAAAVLAQFRAQRELSLKKQKFLVDEGVAAWIEPSRSDDGTVFVQQGGGRDKEKDPPAPPRVAVASENYGRIYRMLDKKVPVTLQLDIENKFYDDDLNSFNIIGEITGTDKAKADEVVMLGAHFDSWHGRA